MIKRSRGAIKGIVQGVGFRPFIYQLTLRYNLTGFVTNTSQGVDLEVEGLDENIECFFKDGISPFWPYRRKKMGSWLGSSNHFFNYKQIGTWDGV